MGGGSADAVTVPALPSTPAPTSKRPLAAIMLVVALGHLTLFPKIADLDGFYHIGHAMAYAAGSIFDTSFPWATQSVIRDRGADLWWGFHVMLLPFAALGRPEAAVRLGALVLTLLLAASFHWALRRHAVPAAGWWTVAFLVAVPNVFFRDLMLRPHLLSLASSLLLLSVLTRGRWWQVALLSAAIAWLHLNLFWMAPGLVAAYTLVCLVERFGSTEGGETLGVPLAHAVAAVLLGTLAGWLLRPHPLAAAELANVQLIRLFAQKATEEPLLFAAELRPIPAMELVRTCWLFLAAWTVAVVAVGADLVRARPTSVSREARALMAGSLLVSAAFLVLALVAARRAMVQWVAFGSLGLAVAWTYSLAPRIRPRVRGLVVALVAVHLAWAAHRHLVNVERVAFPADTMRDVAAFLESHSRPGDVVFHARWDNFGPLFARDRSNLYLGGMDPIFQLAHDPRLYWEYFYLSADVNVEWTCDAFPCAAGVATDTHEVLQRHFGARWVVVEPRRNPRLSLYLLNDRRYALALETPRNAVFEVLADDPPPPAAGAP